MIKGFFFDLDGTLVNTYEADYLAYRDALFEVTKIELQRDGFEALHGMEIGEKLSRLAPSLTDKQIADIRLSKKRHYHTYVHTTKINEALVAFLKNFSPHLQCVLVTTAKQDNVATVLKAHNLRGFFSEIISGDDVTAHKPHPAAYLLALERSGLKPEEVVAFEDSESGIRSAEAAGIAVVPVKEFPAT